MDLGGIKQGLTSDEQRQLDRLVSAAQARFWRDLRSLKEAINSTPEPTGSELTDMEAWARRLGSCETVMVWVLQGYRHRLLGELSCAETVLASAWSLAKQCRDSREHGYNPCQLEVLWRRGMLEMSLGRPTKALAIVDDALAGYGVLTTSAHDLDGDGIATVRLGRADILFDLEDYEGSAAGFASCLTRLEVGNLRWLRTHLNLAWALSMCDENGAKTAFLALNHQRLAHRKREMTVEKATCHWLDGSLAYKLKKQRWEEKLEKGLEGFALLRMPYHYWRVASDIAHTKYPRRDKIQVFLKRVEPVFLDLVKDDRHRRLFGDLKSLCEGTPKAWTLPTLAELLTRIRCLLTEDGVPPSLLPSLA